MLTASDIMTRTVARISPADTIATVARLLVEKNISAVPVCDHEGHVLGIISEGDLVRRLGATQAAKQAWWLDVLAEGEDLAPEFQRYLDLGERTAEQVMSGNVVTATEATSVPEIADLMERHHIKRVPILRDGLVVGIVSRADLVRALARTPQELANIR